MLYEHNIYIIWSSLIRCKYSRIIYLVPKNIEALEMLKTQLLNNTLNSAFSTLHSFIILLILMEITRNERNRRSEKKGNCNAKFFSFRVCISHRILFSGFKHILFSIFIPQLRQEWPWMKTAWNRIPDLHRISTWIRPNEVSMCAGMRTILPSSPRLPVWKLTKQQTWSIWRLAPWWGQIVSSPAEAPCSTRPRTILTN